MPAQKNGYKIEKFRNKIRSFDKKEQSCSNLSSFQVLLSRKKLMKILTCLEICSRQAIQEVTEKSVRFTLSSYRRDFISGKYFPIPTQEAVVTAPAVEFSGLRCWKCDHDSIVGCQGYLIE